MLVARQGLGVGINLAGVVLLTPLIGPTNYGLYMIAFGIVTFLFLAHVYSAAIVLTLGIAAVHAFGLLGAAIGMVVHGLVLSGVSWQRVRLTFRALI